MGLPGGAPRDAHRWPWAPPAPSATTRPPPATAPASWSGTWRDPSNAQADLREAFAAAGFDWATTHTFRKTVATLMDHAGLSSRAAVDQLGHANTSMTTDVYFGRKVATTGAATVLEALGT
jgi:integrase